MDTYTPARTGVIAASASAAVEILALRIRIETHGQELDCRGLLGLATIAADESNRPFRSAHGRLVFRPAGHGALIKNLNELEGDLVFIKNIDNVAPERFHPTTGRWKRLLAGFLVELQREISDLLDSLEQPLPAPEGRPEVLAITASMYQVV